LVPLSLFSLKWRFIDPKHNILPDNDIKKLKPLNGLASQFLDQYAKTNLYSDFPFNNGLFTQIDFIDFNGNNKTQIEEWLLKWGLNSKQEVYLSWDKNLAMIIPFGILVKYFDDFHYPSSDDLIVFQKELQWALLFFHTGRIYYGYKKFNN